MNFFELKQQAEKDGMDVKIRTTKRDIQMFYKLLNMRKRKEKKVQEISNKKYCRICGRELVNNFCKKHGRL